MTAKIIQIRDFQNPKDIARMYSEQALEQQALELMQMALMGEPIVDTAPSEYVAPDQDPA